MPYYGPDEDEYMINLERFFVAGDFVSGVGYGVQLVLWTSCAIHLWRQRRKGKQTAFLLCYITLLLIVETIFSIIQAYTVQVVYIENRNYPGGPWQYFLVSQNQPIYVIFFVTLFVITFMCDLLVVWRCWVIWNALNRNMAYFIIALPSVMLISSFAMGTLWTLESTKPGLSLYSNLPRACGVAYFSLSLGVNIILTVLIVARLLVFRRAHRPFLPADVAQQYLSIATFIVESAALYSLFAAAFLLSYALNAPINQTLLAFAQAAQQVATYLIIYRVADGKAWSRRAIDAQALSSLHFGSAMTARSRPAENSGTSMGRVEVTLNGDPESGAPSEKK